MEDLNFLVIGAIPIGIGSPSFALAFPYLSSQVYI